MLRLLPAQLPWWLAGPGMGLCVVALYGLANRRLGVAGAWLDCHCIEPVVVTQENDGSTYYYSVMVTRKDSGIDSLDRMRGHSLAWADPNSTSGNNVPRFELNKMNIPSAEGYFGKVVFTGSHENAVLALAQGTVDIAANQWTSAATSSGLPVRPMGMRLTI